MKKYIELGDNFKINLPTLMESRLLVQANSGGGKSWLLRRLLEQTHGQVQQIIIDLEGEFYTLREKFDYVLVGASGDVPINLRAAGLLAQRLLKLKASAIIDLSELQKHERKPFVRIFLEALMEARSPKDYNAPCLIVIDEAHQFAPEKEQSEAAAAVTDIMTRGRKRQFCGVLATQRISKLSKDAAAECNNKLIGRSGLDLDMKRGAEELGFTSKEDMRTLRELDPGEFYAFGTAMSAEVVKMHVGSVETSHTRKKNTKAQRIIPPPDKAIKAMLAELADLPQEAETKAKTEKELKEEIAGLKRQIAQKIVDSGTKPTKNDLPMGVSQWMNYGAKYGYDKFFEKKIMQAAGLQWEKVVAEWERYAKHLLKVIGGVVGLLNGVNVEIPKLPAKLPPMWLTPSNIETVKVGDVMSIKPPPVLAVSKSQEQAAREILGTDTGAPGKGEMLMLKAVAQHENGISREHLTILTGYRRSTRDRYIQYLQQKGFVRAALGKIHATPEGMEALGSDFEPLPTGEALREHLLRTLPEGERKILAILFEHNGSIVSRDELTERTNYQRSTRDRYIQYLQARELVESSRDGVRAADKLFE